LSRRSTRSPAAAAALAALLAAAPAAAGPFDYVKGVMHGDTTWSGAVTITGQTVVKKGATLTILPGTTVRFLWIDEDGDGIGDSELNVEGRIVARGEKDKPIVFTSGRPEPKMKDWTFIMISTTRDSILEYCTIEYAFSGAQVHYSSATIRNCLIRRNFEGVRYSTTAVDILNCDFVENYYGLRFEANGSRATVMHNRIEGNRYGIFAPGRGTRTMKIEENNIVNNTEFQVYFGDRQQGDLDFPRNWWGTADPAAIEAGIYDKLDDPLVGKAHWEPALTAPVSPCGVQ
jgi:nitrous oxidase accessory protein NosD